MQGHALSSMGTGRGAWVEGPAACTARKLVLAWLFSLSTASMLVRSLVRRRALGKAPSIHPAEKDLDCEELELNWAKLAPAALELLAP